MNRATAFLAAAFASATAFSFAGEIPGDPVRDPNLVAIQKPRPWRCTSRSPLAATARLDTSERRATVTLAIAGNDARSRRDELVVVDCIRK